MNFCYVEYVYQWILLGCLSLCKNATKSFQDLQTNNFMLLMKTSFSRFQNNHAELSEYSFTLLYINAIFSVQKYSKWMKMLYWNFLPIFVWYINFLINTLRHLSLCNNMHFLINLAVDKIYFDIEKNESINIDIITQY